jgi:hypothetical protein
MDKRRSRNEILATKAKTLARCVTILFLLGTSVSLQAQSQPEPQAAAPGQRPAQQLNPVPQPAQTVGKITGTIVDVSGALVSGAKIRLTRDDQSPAQETLSNDDGQFSFNNIAPGPYHLTVTAQAFATQTISGTLRDGETAVVPPIKLALATEVTRVQVVASQEEIAEAEVKEEEHQRVLGFIPNFYVSYVPDAAPLNTKQKFELAWRVTIDPIDILFAGASAGLQQAQNDFGGYGQGAQGYFKRFGASYADYTTNNFLGGAVFPALLKQDPRYFYKGTGSVRSRILYAIAMSVVARGDNKKWQPDYSGIMGAIASGGISNLYYPAHDRGAGLVFENTGIGIAAAAAGNLLQEFVIKRFTPNLPNHSSSSSSQP